MSCGKARLNITAQNKQLIREAKAILVKKVSSNPRVTKTENAVEEPVLCSSASTALIHCQLVSLS